MLRLTASCMVGVFLLAPACGSREPGSFTATISGALSASVSGTAEAIETSIYSSAGHHFLITMNLPAKLPALSYYEGGLIQIASFNPIIVGSYRAMPYGADNYPVDALHVHFGGATEFTWRAVDGTVTIAAGDVSQGTSSGSFRVRFSSIKVKSDTIEIRGDFRIP